MSRKSLMSMFGVLLALPFIASCNTTGTLQAVEGDCLVQYPTYSAAWNCARNKQLYNSDEYRVRYVATGDALLDQVNRGQISDAMARDSMAGGFSRGGRGGGGRR